MKNLTKENYGSRMLEMVVLTKSCKYGSNCVAGIDLANGQWVRLVTSDEKTHGAVSDEELTCANGYVIQKLDVIYVSVLKANPNPIQPENVLLDTRRKVEFVRKMQINEVEKYHRCEKRIKIFWNKYEYVKEEHMNSKDVSKLYSLTMSKVNNLYFYHTVNKEGKLQPKVEFDFNGVHYKDMSVTDRDYKNVEDGRYYEEAALVTSIGSVYKGKYYKYVAGIYA